MLVCPCRVSAIERGDGSVEKVGEKVFEPWGGGSGREKSPERQPSSLDYRSHGATGATRIFAEPHQVANRSPCLSPLSSQSAPYFDQIATGI